MNVENKEKEVLDDYRKYVSDYKCNALDSYEWKISDSDMMNEIKTAPNTFSFVSDLFELFGFKMLLEFVPNGEEKTDIGDSKLYVSAVSFPVNISSFACCAVLRCRETSAVYLSAIQFDRDTRNIMCNVGALKDLQNMSQFTFTVEMILIDVFDKDGCCITNDWIQSLGSNNNLSMI